MTESGERLYMEREKRVSDAIALRTPDRVPIAVTFAFFPSRIYGCTMEEMVYDRDTLFEVQMRAARDYEPDLVPNSFGLMLLGPLLDALDYRQMQWPGRQLGPDVPYQFVEGEYMMADEYDHLLSDPMDFIIRKYWPRISGALKGLEMLPSFGNFTTFMRLGLFGSFGLPEVQGALEALKRAGMEAQETGSYARRFDAELKEAGFPSQGGGLTQAPFDMLGDYLRGTKGLMLDMYRQPDRVIKACEKLLPAEIDRGVNSAKRAGSRFVFIALHKGLDGFMSPKQFDRFYWPTLRELVIALIDEGLTPYLFWEGDCTSRLEQIKEIPPGKTLYRFEATDMIKAKDILGDRVCIRGNVPLSLLATGEPEDVKLYCKKLIDYAGRDGGFIMDSSAGLNDAKPENVRVMFDFTKEYGVY